MYGVGYTDDDRKAKNPVIYNNAILGMRTLVENAGLLNIAIESAELADEFMTISPDAEVDETVGGYIKTLWADPGIQETFRNKAQFQLFDAADYFFEHIDRISTPDYIATDDDILRCRVRTSGIVEEIYKIDGAIFVMYDVGGQRNERKKWIHCFDNVTAVIFVAAINEYDQVLYEDNTQNRLIEALTLFKEIANSPYFQKTSMILFLNKRDLFEKKIKVHDIRRPSTGPDDPGMFLDYECGICTCGGGYPNDYPCECGVQQAAINYIKGLFLAQSGDGKDVYTCVTCATDSNNVRHVFDSCKQIILNNNLVNNFGGK